MTIADVPDLYPTEPLPVRLMNTVWANREGVHDSLTSVAQLQQWARQCGMRPSSGLSRSDLDQARDLRDALRRLAAYLLDDHRLGAVSDRLAPREALQVINRYLAASSPELRPGDGAGLHREWRSSMSGFGRELVTIALDASEILAGSHAGLGACHGPNCVLYFERAPARREWCSSGCGNRARVARHYRRSKD